MSKVTIFGKKRWEEVLEIIDNVEEYYCTNGMFYVKFGEQECYFALDLIGIIYIEAESEGEAE
jgi:hypothetical protein